MIAVETLPEVENIEHTWIPMKDGVRLSARIWKPEDADENPVPAILEYIPYRKRDMKRSRDTQMHHYFAAHGYVAIRVDLRGSGASEGVLTDEYLPQELDDGVEILNWLEKQPWCDGNVGMIGISWGGFNGLQIAAKQPKQLKSVISLCSTDDRYADDVHYMGGCLLNDNLSWASTMFAFNSLPPDPQIVGEDNWRDMWIQRLEGSGLWVDQWMRHQERDDYWKHGSICEDYDAIKCPVMAVSGWADGYSNAVFRMVKNLKVPCKGLVGPWSHIYPQMATTGPQIGFLQEALRWFDHWMKDKDTGVDEDPDIQVWMQDSVAPKADYRKRPGRWVAEPEWPSPNIYNETYKFDHNTILKPGEEPKNGDRISIQSPLSVGLFAGKWCSYSVGPDLPHDQREEDGGSLVFDSEPLDETFEILGAPVVNLEVSSNKPVAMVAVRLSDVAPDGKSTRVTYGLLNLCHRFSHEFPKKLEPGKKEQIRIELNDIAQTFPKGHRIRVSVSTSYWPLAWTPPEPVQLTVTPAKSSLELPVRPRRKGETEEVEEFEPPVGAPEPEKTIIEPTDHNWIITRDLAKDESTLHVYNDEGTHRIDEINLEITKRTDEWYRFIDDDFESVNGEVKNTRRLKRGDEWDIRTETRTLLTCTKDEFQIHATLDAYEHERRVFTKTWDRRIPRLYI